MAPITTPFGARSTAEEVVAGCSLSGRRIIVTGAASGIGIETARALALTGAEVTLAVRNLTAGAETAASLAASTGNPNIRAVHLDLSVLASVSAFVADWHGPLHVLVNNAGVMALPELQHTPEGYELQFATNHLGHFALALGLRPALAAAGAARIVSVSSSAHLRSPVVSTTSISPGARTSRFSPTRSRRRRTCSSPWRPTHAGKSTASPPTLSTRAASQPTCSCIPGA
jgi:NAD(P)-dependent dehydrogenase (short-subunit alcohol dehydrogenase family)